MSKFEQLPLRTARARLTSIELYSNVYSFNYCNQLMLEKQTMASQLCQRVCYLFIRAQKGGVLQLDYFGNKINLMFISDWFLYEGYLTAFICHNDSLGLLFWSTVH